MKFKSLFIFIACFFSTVINAEITVQLWNDQWTIPLLVDEQEQVSERYLELCDAPDSTVPLHATLTLQPSIAHSTEFSLPEKKFKPFGKRCQSFQIRINPVTTGLKKAQVATDSCYQGNNRCGFSVGVAVNVLTPEEYNARLVGRFFPIGQFQIFADSPMVDNLQFINNDEQLMVSSSNKVLIYDFDRQSMRLSFSHSFPISSRNSESPVTLCPIADKEFIQIDSSNGKVTRLDANGVVLSDSEQAALDLCSRRETANLRFSGDCSPRNPGPSGYLETQVTLFTGKQWGYVCDDFFQQDELAVACRELGFSPGAIIPYGQRDYCGQTSGPFVYDDVRCEGTEDHLSECMGIFGHDCTLDEVIAIECQTRQGQSNQPYLKSLSPCAALSQPDNAPVHFCGGMELQKVNLLPVHNSRNTDISLDSHLDPVLAGESFAPEAWVPLDENTLLLTNTTHGMLVNLNTSSITDLSTDLKGAPLLAIIENSLLSLDPEQPDLFKWLSRNNSQFTQSEEENIEGINQPKQIAVTQTPGVIAVSEEGYGGTTVITFFALLGSGPLPTLFRTRDANGRVSKVVSVVDSQPIQADSSSTALQAQILPVFSALLIARLLTALP